MSPHERWAWLAVGTIVLGAVTCALPSYDFQEGGGAAGAGASGGGGTAGDASGGGGSTGGHGGITAPGGGGSGAGGGSTCGNGVIEDGEDCDDSGQQSSGCDDCRVVCDEPDKLDGATNHCYRAVSDGTPGTWSLSDARQACGAWEGELVAISSAAELAFIQSAFFNACLFLWTGGQDVGTGDPNGVWENGEDWYGDWLSGEPNAGPGSCVILHTNCTFADEDCSTLEHGYMCERRPPGEPSP